MELAFEIALFRAIMKARPVGIHKHFQLLAVQRSMSVELGEEVDVNDIWSKLATLYSLDGLDNQDLAEDDFLSSVEPFELPHESEFVELWQRRALKPAEDGASPPASPIPTPEDQAESSLSEAEMDIESQVEDTKDDTKQDKKLDTKPTNNRRRSTLGRFTKNEDVEEDEEEEKPQIDNDDEKMDEDDSNTRSSRSKTAKAAVDAPKKARGGGRPRATRGRTSTTRSNPKRR